MTERRHPLHVVAVAGSLLLMASAPALARQSVSASGPSAVTAQPKTSNGTRALNEQSVQHPGHAPVGTVLGVPVVIAAPVNAPYNAAAAYSTYGGQPGGGMQAVLSESVPGTSR